MIYKCKNCLKFKDLNDVHFAKCPCCQFTVARCNSSTCGGKLGALRSVYAHVRYYASGRAGGGVLSGFLAHSRAADTVARPFKVLAGGRR